MRTVIVCGLVGLGLGLAVYWLPRAAEQDSVASVRDAERTEVAIAPVESSPAQSSDASGAAVSVASEQREAEGDAEEPTLLALDAAPQDRPGQLLAGGFTRARAVEILQREAELRREMASHQFASTGTVQPLSASVPSAVEQQLRREMGDLEYEKYLGATGQTTRVSVGEVESESAAANAGIQSGDEILAYAGRRVFSLGELTALMAQTPEGDTVATTVVRDGQTMQLYVTGGVLGISQARQPR